MCCSNLVLKPREPLNIQKRRCIKAGGQAAETPSGDVPKRGASPDSPTASPQALGEPTAASACDSRMSFQNLRSRKIISTPRWPAQGLHSGKDTARGCQGDARKKKDIRSGARRKAKGPLPPVRMEAKRQELCSGSRRGQCRKKGAPGASPPANEETGLGGTWSQLEPTPSKAPGSAPSGPCSHLGASRRQALSLAGRWGKPGRSERSSVFASRNNADPV